MKHLVAFAFLLMVLCVNAQNYEDLEACTQLAGFTGPSSPNKCAYYEDVVRCGIGTLDLLDNSVSNETIEIGRNWSNKLLTENQCNKDFREIFDEVKAAPQILNLQECFVIPDTTSQFCRAVEEAVRCAIVRMGLHKDNASTEDMQFLREGAARYLTPLRCGKTFDDILTEVKVEAAVEQCVNLAQYLSELNPESTCAYIEDAVRCGINVLDLSGENAAVDEANQKYVTAADEYLSENNCSKRFEAIIYETTTSPQLLKLQQCYATAIEKGLQNFMESCTHVEEAVICGIDALELHGENALNETLQFGREMATRYLKPFNCTKTFDEILDEAKSTTSTVSTDGISNTTTTAMDANEDTTTITTNNNNNNKGDGNKGSTASPVGWLTAVLVGLILMFTAVY